MPTSRSLQKHISIETGGSKHDEKTPLLASSSHHDDHFNTTKAGNRSIVSQRGGRRLLLTFQSLFVFAVVGGLALFLFYSRSSSEDVKSLEHLVQISDSGEYTVTYPGTLTATDTFADLAKLMVPVWFEASLLALAVFSPAVDPSQVHNARKCLLTTRNLLDVFSPVYSNRNHLWKNLRNYYKQGYELAGSFQDLAHGNVTFDQDLWNQRRNILLEWKNDFQSYQQKHSTTLLFFLLHPHQRGCFAHKESHLFWAELASSDHPLPCGNDLATPSLQRLANLQLQNALTYLHVILQYDNVLSREHQLEYHNLRKELRSFLDECNLFGFVLFPNVLDKKELSATKILVEARTRVGNLNDHWEKFNLYRTTNRHPSEQVRLEEEIIKEWDSFKEWSQKDHLADSIQLLIHSTTA